MDNEQLEIFNNDIELYIKLFCEEQNIESMKTESQSIWNGCLIYIYNHVFKNNKDLLRDKKINNYNMYDFELINNICDTYIYYCLLYDKEVSIIGFSRLLGINPDTIHEWKKPDNAKNATSQRSDIWKKLTESRQESLSNKLLTGKNPVGVIAILNHFYGWNSPYANNSNVNNTTRISRDEMQQLPKTDNLPQLPTIDID